MAEDQQPRCQQRPHSSDIPPWQKLQNQRKILLRQIRKAFQDVKRKAYDADKLMIIWSATYEKPGLSPRCPEAEGVCVWGGVVARMEADRDPTPSQTLHRDPEDRILIPARKNRPPKAVTSSCSSSSLL